MPRPLVIDLSKPLPPRARPLDDSALSHVFGGCSSDYVPCFTRETVGIEVPTIHCCYPRVCKIIPGPPDPVSGLRHGRCGLSGGAAFG